MTTTPPRSFRPIVEHGYRHRHTHATIDELRDGIDGHISCYDTTRRCSQTGDIGPVGVEPASAQADRAARPRGHVSGRTARWRLR